MKRRTILIIAVAVLSTALFVPWTDNPAKYVHWRDRIRSSPPIALLIGEPCATYKNDLITYDPGPDCYRYEAPQRFSGIWLYEFEGSTFLDNAKKVPLHRPQPNSTSWLKFRPEKIRFGPDYDDYDEKKDCFTVSAFSVDFVGRRRMVEGGHMGLWASDTIVDRMINATPLPSPDCRAY